MPQRKLGAFTYCESNSAIHSMGQSCARSFMDMNTILRFSRACSARYTSCLYGAGIFVTQRTSASSGMLAVSPDDPGDPDGCPAPVVKGLTVYSAPRLPASKRGLNVPSHHGPC